MQSASPFYSDAYRRHVEAEEDALGLTDDLLRAYRDEAQTMGATALPCDHEIDGAEFPHMSETMRQWLDDDEAGR